MSFIDKRSLLDTIVSMESKTSNKKPHIFRASVVFILLVLLTLLSVYMIRNSDGSPRQVKKMRTLITDTQYIIHAGGKLKGKDGKTYTYTNSKESLKRMYKKGNRIVELDFAFTTDGECVCLHSWKDTKYTNDSDHTDSDKEGIPLSLADFTSVKINGYFTPMTLSDVIEFMESHKDVILITDIKETHEPIAGTDEEVDVSALCRRISDRAPKLKNRCIIQIYDESEYDTVKELGFSNMIYTLYQLTDEQRLDTAAHQQFASEHPLVAFTFPKGLVKNKTFISGMQKTKVPLLTHTIDSKKKKLKLLEAGTVSGVYTNDTENP